MLESAEAGLRICVAAVLASLLMLTTPPARAVNVQGDYLALHEHADLLEDPEERFNPALLSEEPLSGQFRPGANILPDIGGVPHRVWLRMHPSLPDGSRPENWLIYVMQTELDDLCVYWPVLDGSYLKKCSGLNARRQGEHGWHRDYLLHLPADLDPRRPWFLYAQTRSWLAIPVELMTLDQYMRRDHRDQHVWGIYYGAYLALVLFAVFAWIALRDSVWLLFGLHYVFLGLAFYALQGRPMDFNFPLNTWWTAAGAPSLFSLFVVFGCLFYRRFLDIPEYTKWGDRLLLCVAAAGCLVAVYAGFDPMGGYPLLGVLGLLFAGSCLLFSAWRSWQGHRPAYYALTGLGLLLLVGFIKSIELLGLELLPPEPSLNLFRFCALAGAAVILLGLAQRVRLLQEERDRAAQQNELRRKELEASNSELREFAFVASHDLKQPLRSVAGFAGLLAERYRGQLDNEADEYLNYIESGAKRADRLIAELLEFSGSRNQQLNLDIVDARSVVDRALHDLDETLSGSDALITIAELPTIHADPTELSRVFHNLVHNAIVHARQDRAPQIEISGKEIPDGWEFQVRDHGPGLPDNMQERIFKIFSRGDADSQSGTGVGLAVCRRIVTRHGGTIWAENHPGGGAVFRFRIPDTRRS